MIGWSDEEVKEIKKILVHLKDKMKLIEKVLKQIFHKNFKVKVVLKKNKKLEHFSLRKLAKLNVMIECKKWKSFKGIEVAMFHLLKNDFNEEFIKLRIANRIPNIDNWKKEEKNE